MKKMVATKAFYNYKGYDRSGKAICFASGVITGIEDFNETRNCIIEEAKKINENVWKLNLIALTPLEFEIQE